VTGDPRVRRTAVVLLLVVAAGALALSFTGLALLGALAGSPRSRRCSPWWSTRAPARRRSTG